MLSLAVCAALAWPAYGAAQTSTPDDPAGPLVAAPEVPEGAPNVCFSNYTGGVSADFLSLIHISEPTRPY